VLIQLRPVEDNVERDKVTKPAGSASPGRRNTRSGPAQRTRRTRTLPNALESTPDDAGMADDQVLSTYREKSACRKAET